MNAKSEEVLRRIVREEFEQALTVEIQWEKIRDETTGQPLKHPERRAEKVFLPAFLVQQISFHEGALRGLQEDVSKANNRAHETTARIEAIGRTLLCLEGSMKSVARFSSALKVELLGRSAEALGIPEGREGVILIESNAR